MPALALVSSTYLGGSGYEQVNGVAVGTDGAVYVTGFTSSGNTGAGTFPVGSQAGATPTAIVVGTVNSGTQVAFATKFNSATALSSRSYSSVFGAGGETANGIAVDPDGVSYVVGSTKSPMFSQSAQGLCGVFSVGGTLPVASSNGTAIQWTAVCPTDPNQTQGFLVALTAPSAVTGSAGGQVLYLALQNPTTVHDAANVAGCNLNLDKNGGTLNGPVLGVTFCAGAYGSWNAVATVSDEQAYVTGQVGVGAQAGDVARYNRAGNAFLVATRSCCPRARSACSWWPTRAARTKSSASSKSGVSKPPRSASSPATASSASATTAKSSPKSPERESDG